MDDNRRHQKDVEQVVSRIYSRCRRLLVSSGVSRNETKLCVLCCKKPGVCFDHVCLCKPCSKQPIALYTAWISLGKYQNNQHSLLEFVPASMHADFSHIDEEKVMEKEMPKGFKTTGKWMFAAQDGMGLYDMVLFNCKVAHRAMPVSTTALARMSLDVRFAIRHDK